MVTEELHNAPIKYPDIQKFRRIPEKSLYDPQGFTNQCWGYALVFRIQHVRPMRIRIQGFDDQNLKKLQVKKKVIFLIKNCNLIIPRTP
jgi:hypothetical protein